MLHFKSGTQSLKRYFALARKLIREDKSLRLISRIAWAKLSKQRQSNSAIYAGKKHTWTPSVVLNSPPVYVDKRKIVVAVTAHIFYEEYIQKLFDALKNFPFKYDLFITTSKPELLTIIEKMFENPEVGIKVVLTPNKGRHFAPLLVEFSTDLMKYEYALHVHSKKSLHAPNIGSAWANALWNSIIEDTQLIHRVMNEFINDSNIAIYYPYFGGFLPHWTYTWGRNEHVAKKFLSALNINIPSSPIAFPAGGMFWIRPQLFLEFLNFDFSYDQFPDERGQLDGTLQHALERIVGVLPDVHGLKHLVHIQETNVLTTDTSFIWSTFECNSAAELLSKLENYQVISFDFFDTLYRRKHQYADIAKIRTGERLFELKKIEPKFYVETRNQIDLSLRLKKNRDITLKEVCDELAVVFDVDSNYLVELECYFELMEAGPRSEIVKIANELSRQGRKLLIVSDTYYSSEFLEQLARQIGLNCEIKIYSSSDNNARKDSGELWMKIMSTKNFSGGSFIHVGDNFLSDAQIPGDLGLQTTLIMSGEAKWRKYGMPEMHINLDTMLNDESIYTLSEVMSDFGDSPF
jgi:FMN phosphatase YigB (HAD superfamily)